MQDSFILAFTVICNGALGGIILLNNPRSRVNRAFFYLTTTVVLWAVVNFLADNAATHNLLYTRLAFLFGVGAGLAIYNSGRVIVDKTVVSRQALRIQVLLAGLTAFFSLSPYLIPSVSKGPDGSLEVQTGFLLPFYAFYLFMIVVLGIHNYIKSYRLANNLQKNQIKLMVLGISMWAAFALSSNLVVPVLVDDWESSRYGPISTIVFVGFTAYAITKHSLLDIRVLAARAFAYFLTVLALSVTFLIIVFLLARSALDIEGDATASGVGMLVVFSVIAAMSFNFIKKHFLRISNRIFYRDAYSYDQVVDELSGVLAGEVQLEQISKKGLRIIENALQPTDISLVVLENKKPARRFGSSKAASLRDEDLKLMLGAKPRVCLADQTEDAKLKQALSANGIATMQKVIHKGEPVALLLLGNKKNGSIFNRHDVELLGTAANSLAIAISNASYFEEIKNFNERLVNEVEVATKRLRDANKRLRQLDAAKDEFISATSHQLRPKLTVAKGMIDMILDEVDGPLNERQKKSLKQAENTIDRMTSVVTDILDSALTDADQIRVSKRKTDIEGLIREEVKMHEKQAARRDIDITVKVSADQPAYIDEVKIREALSNLLHNAIQYSRPKTTVEIGAGSDKNGLHIVVSDRGIGIKKQDQAKLFEKFFRAKDAKEHEPSGTGIGLFIVKKIIDAHGGEVIIESTYGEGSKFGFNIPADD